MCVRLHPAVRHLAQQRAVELGRSFSAYVEQLVWRDLAAAHQADRGGLTEGAPIEMHGVEIGTVHRVRLADPATVHLVLSIDRDAPITRATTAVLTARGLAARGFMGYVYIALENTGTDLLY